METVLVTGATGNVGLEVARGLQAAGARVRAAVLPAQAARRPLGEGVEHVAFDFLDPSTFPRALEGVGRVFLLRPPQISSPKPFEPLLEAFEAAGVGQVVFLSLLGAQKNRVVPHRKIEDRIRARGLPYVFLRPSFFMQNLATTHRDDIRELGEILVPAGEGRTSFIDARDIAAVAVRALLEGHRDVAYDLTGAEALTYGEVAQVFSEVLGRRVVYSRPGPLRFALHMRRRGFPWPFIGVMVGIYGVARLGLAGRVTGEVRRLLGREPIPLRQFVHDYRHTWTGGTT